MADNELKNGYYEGPRENQYEGWTQEEIDDDLKKAFEKNKELKELTVIPKVFHIAFNLRFFSIKHPLKIYSY